MKNIKKFFSNRFIVSLMVAVVLASSISAFNFAKANSGDGDVGLNEIMNNYLNIILNRESSDSIVQGNEENMGAVTLYLENYIPAIRRQGSIQTTYDFTTTGAINAATLNMTGAVALDAALTVGTSLTVGTTLGVTGLATLPFVTNTPQEVIASSTPASASGGNAIAVGTLSVTITGDNVTTDAYVNLPDTIATGTPIFLHNDSGVAVGVATASTTNGLLQAINGGTAGTGSPSATSSLGNGVTMKCNLGTSFNWLCINYDSTATSSTTPASRITE
jgi:hypothetical protein